MVWVKIPLQTIKNCPDVEDLIFVVPWGISVSLSLRQCLVHSRCSVSVALVNDKRYHLLSTCYISSITQGTCHEVLGV